MSEPRPHVCRAKGLRLSVPRVGASRTRIQGFRPMSPTDDSSPFEIAFGAVLEALVPGATVHGVLGAWPVDVVSVRWFGREGILLHYREPNGNLGSTVLRRQDEARLSIASGGRDHAFDGDGAAWRLAAEALRLRYAALFDPLLAVAGSDLQPLPHQIKAVYGELLPRTPLRFLRGRPRCRQNDRGWAVHQGADPSRRPRALPHRCPGRVGAAVDGRAVRQVRLELRGADQLPSSSRRLPAPSSTTIRCSLRGWTTSRRTDLLELLDRSDWDLVVVDEAHRMSAHYFGPELKATKRYQLGQLLGRVTRHLLLMTATPTPASRRTSSCSWRSLMAIGSKAASATGSTRSPGRSDASHGQGRAHDHGREAALP